MSALVAVLLAAASWTDTTGRLRCEVPDGFTPQPEKPWAFARADGLRRLVFLPVRPVPEGPDARAQQLLGRVGAPGGLLHGEPDVSAALVIAPTDVVWAGVLVMGPATADVGAEARSLAAACRAVKPLIENGRVRDSARTVSCAVPPGAEAVELRGGGAAKGPGWWVWLIAVRPKGTSSLSELAAAWLQPSGAAAQAIIPGASAGRSTATASGHLLQSNVDYVVEMTVVELPDGNVAGIGLSSAAGVQTQARAAAAQMLSTLTVEPPPAAGFAPAP